MVDLKLTDLPTAESYVAGKLSGEESARFEEAMIERPALAADVNVRRRIKSGLALLEERNELAPLLASAPRPQYLRYAAAAAVVVLVAGFWSTWRGVSEQPAQALVSASEMGTRKAAGSFMLVLTRSAKVSNFPVQRNAGPVLLQIVADDPTAAPFEVRLIAHGKSSEATALGQSSIPNSTDGYAEVYLDPRELESGSYEISLKSNSGAEQIFPFTLTIAP
jgi:hypothetical protein